MDAYLTNIRTGLFGPPGPAACPPSRLILEATAPLDYRATVKGRKLSLLLPGATLNIPAGTTAVFDGLMTTVEIGLEKNGSPLVTITLTEEAASSIKEIAGLPYQLVIDIDRSPLNKYFAGRHILLDPAWDGKKRGAVSPTGLPEHIPTLDIARRLAQLLHQSSARVSLTRIDNSFIPIPERLRLARELQPDLFIGIAAWVEKRNPRSGFRVRFYYGNLKSELLAAALHRELARKVSIPSHGLLPVNMTLLRENPAPATLAEVACISHRLDEGLLRDADFRQRVAQGLFNGTQEFFRSCRQDYSP